MQLTEVSAKTGYVWFRQGLWLFRKKPFAFLMLVILYLLATMLIAQIPVHGAVILPFLFVPGFAAGFMAACRETVAGHFALPTLLFDGFVAHGKRAAQRLLLLGVLYVFVLMLESLLLFLILEMIDRSLPHQIIQSLTTPGVDPLPPVARILVVIQVWQLLGMLTTLVFWFASVASAWHDASPAKAIFFGVVGTWRNRGAFIVYGALWYAVLTAASLLPVVMLMAKLSLAYIQMAAMATTLVTLIIMTMICCSLYAAYRGCFSQQEPNPKVPPETASPGNSQ